MKLLRRGKYTSIHRRVPEESRKIFTIFLLQGSGDQWPSAAGLPAHDPLTHFRQLDHSDAQFLRGGCAVLTRFLRHDSDRPLSLLSERVVKTIYEKSRTLRFHRTRKRATIRGGAIQPQATSQ
ncbi:MAG: hypothetical protein HRU71_00295 [Planctomycetia bacterium]|nr:MAG: hypothetical protein HRU71_00295 [Planctomycetia bacterium]